MKEKGKGACEGSGGKAANPRRPSPTEKEARRAQRRLERERAELTRGNALARLLTRGTIDKAMHEAGIEVRQLWIEMSAGPPAIDFTVERVSGSPQRREHVAVSAIDAEGALRRMILASQMGAEAADVVIRVCGLDMLLTPIAIDREEDEAARRQGGCRKETLALVRYLLRAGLAALVRLRSRRQGRGDVSAAVRAWLAEGARPTDVATGERPDLGTRG